jgi:chromate transporter
MDQSGTKIFFRFLRFGLLAWGGPVAQIAMIKKELVEDEQWVSKEQFNRALAVYQVLPGPEAHELCVYFGMKAKGRWGGFLAGLGFMLPGFLLMLLFTWIYIRFGIQSPRIQILFAGIQVAVVALIAFAVYRIGKHAIVNKNLWLVAFLSAFAFVANTNFLWILLFAGIIYSLLQMKKRVLSILLIAGMVFYNGYNLYHTGISPVNAKEDITGPRRSISNEPEKVFITGLKGGLLTFGGAYTAIPFIREDAVVKSHWMSEAQFLDGIALSGILPAPLIIFSTFVGYFGAGWLGAILITIGIFLPAFSFTLLGHSLMERLIANKSLHNFLDGVTAGVVGLIAMTAVQLLLRTVNNATAIVILIASLAVLLKFKSKYAAILLIAGAGLISLLSYSIF